MDGVKRIALAGPIFAGKDHLAEFIRDKYNYKIFGFSDEVKKLACKLFPFIADDDWAFHTREQKEEEVVYSNPDTGEEWTRRKIYQAMDVLPQIYAPFYANRLSLTINDYLDVTIKKHEGIVIKDLRRPAELRYIKNNKFTLIYIKRNHEKCRDHQMQHRSESFQSLLEENADYVFWNNNYGYNDWDNFLSDKIKVDKV